jgi:hypothetical protein
MSDPPSSHVDGSIVEVVSQSTGGCGRPPRPMAASRALHRIHRFPSEFAPCPRPRWLALAGLPIEKPLPRKAHKPSITEGLQFSTSSAAAPRSRALGVVVAVGG